jgi:cytochrome c5
MNKVTLITIAIAGASISAQQPAANPADVLKSRCVLCHESDIITSQHLSLTGWTNSINKMVRWGSTITPQEREALQPYLAANYGPKPAASHASTDAGLATYKRACLVCHDADIITQQKLTPTGWTRSVEKMTRWGAAVTDADKAPLVEYLAAQYPPR